MGLPFPPLVLALAAIAADVGGLHRLAFYLVLLAIPLAAGCALAAAGDLAVGARGGARAACGAAALALLVLSSAVRTNAAHGATVPPLALSALLGCVGAYALLGVIWLVRVPQQASEATA